ncbi:MAG: hypothetical protein JSY10_09020 [Paenibacillus sp.]|nr:hypothetical protein [Paenibacillus sp.]
MSYNFCDGFDRVQTEKKLKDDIDDCIFEMPNSDGEDREFKQWRKNQIDNDFPVSILVVKYNIAFSVKITSYLSTD